MIRDVGFFLVPASRTWDRVVSFGSELFRRVVASAAGQPAESVLGERDRLRAPQQRRHMMQEWSDIIDAWVAGRKHVPVLIPPAMPLLAPDPAL